MPTIGSTSTAVCRPVTTGVTAPVEREIRCTLAAPGPKGKPVSSDTTKSSPATRRLAGTASLVGPPVPGKSVFGTLANAATCVTGPPGASRIDHTAFIDASLMASPAALPTTP